MKRILPAGFGAVAAVLVLAVPAFAKGPGSIVDGRAIIAGPGLSTPIEMRGSVSLYGEQVSQPDTGARELSAFIVGAGLVSTEAGYFGERPEGDVGPAYLVTIVINQDPPVTITQDLYPFAAGGPVFFNPPGQKAISGNPLVSGWWHAPTLVLGILQSHGLPVTPPRVNVPVASPAQPAQQPVIQASRSSRTWIIVLLLGVVTVVLAAVLVERQRATHAAA